MIHQIQPSNGVSDIWTLNQLSTVVVKLITSHFCKDQVQQREKFELLGT
jgi:hypothetical protein